MSGKGVGRMLWLAAGWLLAVIIMGIPSIAKASEAVPNHKEASWLVDALNAEPTVQSGLFRVESTELIESDGHDIGQATIKFVYLDIDGEPKDAQSRLFVRRDTVDSGQKVPLPFFAHYELDPSAGASYCKKGWAALTPHLNGELPLGNSFNLDLALLQWARRLPFVDRTHLVIEGGSAGGYMALAMAAEMFPVAATVADAPILNWSYNLAYFDRNLKLAQGGIVPGEDPLTLLKAPIPCLAAVAQLAGPLEELFGKDVASPIYRDLSPVHYFDRITSPVSLTLSTADVLVPMPQLSTRHFIPPDAEAFPEGFEIRLQALASAPGTNRPLLEVLPAEKQAVYVHKIPENTPEIDLKAAATGKLGPAAGPPFDRPYDAHKQWSIVIFDEGKPTTQCTHVRYHFEQNADSFKANYQKAPLSPEQLNVSKLRRLMERFTGTLADSPPLRPDKGSAEPVHRLNFPELEQLDVVTGLLDYAFQGAQFETRLNELYPQLPTELQPWGPSLDMSNLRHLRQELAAAAVQVSAER